MKNLTTITGRELKITANNSARTFTIRTSFAKYRTCKMSRQEFLSALRWTGNDWQEFLKTDEYYVVK